MPNQIDAHQISLNLDGEERRLSLQRTKQDGEVKEK